jgi:uncharacterized protein YecT (DUF1311 family)
MAKGRQMSTAWYFWIFATYLPSAPASAAPQVTAHDTATITQCLAHDKGGEACIGIVFDSCDIEDQKACAGRELAVWNELLQALLNIVNASSPPAIRSAVAEAQSNWLKSRESLCPIFDDVDPGMYSGGANYCRLQETRRRALILKCLSASHDKGDHGETCIEIVAGPCKLGKSEDPKACAARKLADSTKSLQATLKGLKVHSSLDSEVQSNWLKSREGLCSVFDIIDPGMYRAGSVDCRLVETRVRAEILERLLEAVSEH